MLRKKLSTLMLLALFLTLIPFPALAHPGDQHGDDSGHLFGTGEWGTIEHVGDVRVSDAEEGLIADLTVFGNYAYLARWGGTQCAGPERRGQQSPDGGVYIIDISDLENPVEVGFIATHQDTLVGEGMQALHIETAKFTGNVLALNHEGCGKNYKGGFSLRNVSNPLKPVKLSEHFGDFTVGGIQKTPHDANQYHSIFMWQDDGGAYLVATDNEEFDDVDIFDISNPKKPQLVGEFDLNDENVSQPDLRLNDSFLHDMVVKEINGTQIMLLSYWDGGYILLNVEDPAAPQFLSDTDYEQYNTELLALPEPIQRETEGNGHQAEFTSDNAFVIATDEDFDPYVLAIQTAVGEFPARLGTNTTGAQATAISGPTVFVGLACPGGTALPAGDPNNPATAVVERGVCLFTEKLQAVEAAGGWDAVIIMNREGADACKANLVPSVESELPVVFTPRDAGYTLFNAESEYDQDECMAGDGTAIAPMEIGDSGQPVITVDLIFDGWGYVHLFATDSYAPNEDVTELDPVDTFAIPEALDEYYATGHGDLSVHEVATHPTDPSRSYLSYYAGGIRALKIVCAVPGDKSTCTLVEVGGYLDPEGNNFWGVEVFERDSVTYILGSDRDSGLWIFRDPPLPSEDANVMTSSAENHGPIHLYLPLTLGD